MANSFNCSKNSPKKFSNYENIPKYGADEFGNLYGIDLDAKGHKIERTKKDYPYSYSLHCTWIANKKILEKVEKMKKSCVDSDRLFQYNPNKYNSSCRSVFDDIRQDFNHRSPESIEEFLRLYYEDNSIILYEIKECCNVSNGFPVWSFMFAIES